MLADESLDEAPLLGRSPSSDSSIDELDSGAGVMAGTRDEADAHGGAVVDAVTTATSPRAHRHLSGGSHDVENGAELTARRALTHSRSGSDTGNSDADGIEMNELRPRSRNTSTPNLTLLTREWSKSVLSDGELNCYSSVYEDGDSIDWVRESIVNGRDRARNARLPKSFLNTLRKLFYRTQGWIFIVLVGVTTGLLGAIIEMGVNFFTGTKFGFCTTDWWLTEHICCVDPRSCAWRDWSDTLGIPDGPLTYLFSMLIYTIMATSYAGLAGWLTFSLCKWAAGSGITEVKAILNGYVIKNFASFQTLVVKFLGLILSVSSGLSVGKEGPLVHIGCCAAEVWVRLFPKYYNNEAKKREIMSAAMACGVSVAFGSPIGGTIFGLEECSYYFPHKNMWRAFFGSVIAVLVVQFIDPMNTGKVVVFEGDFSSNWKVFELVPFLVTAALGGLCGALFIKLNLRLCQYRKTSAMAKHPILEIVCVAAATALISYPNDYTRHDTEQVLSRLFSTCSPIHKQMAALCDLDAPWKPILWLIFAAICRLGFSIWTFGLKVPGGLFIPALGVGACMGRAIGIITQCIQRGFSGWQVFTTCPLGDHEQCVDPGVYALLGATAVLSGYTRMTISLVVIAFEMTGNVDYIFPIVLAVLVSKWVANAFGRNGIYDEHVIMAGYPFLDIKTRVGDHSHVLAEIMHDENIQVIDASAHNTIRGLENLLERTSYSGYPLVSNAREMLLVGYIARRELQRALEAARTNGAFGDSTYCCIAQEFSSPQLDAQPEFHLRPWFIVRSQCTSSSQGHTRKATLRFCLTNAQLTAWQPSRSQRGRHHGQPS